MEKKKQIRIGSEITSKRLRARYLIVVKGFSQKETANIVGVSTKTMCKWVSLYKWDDQQTKEVRQAGGLLSFMRLFFEYVRSTTPEHLKPFATSWYLFLKHHERTLDKSGESKESKR
jgi:hypothetical protein